MGEYDQSRRPVWIGRGRLSASLQWTSADRKTTVTLKGNDLLQTSNMTTRIHWGLQQCRTDLNWDRRSLTLTALHRFGGYREKKRAETDTDRLGR